MYIGLLENADHGDYVYFKKGTAVLDSDPIMKGKTNDKLEAVALVTDDSQDKIGHFIGVDQTDKRYYLCQVNFIL